MANYALLVGYTLEDRPIFISKDSDKHFTVNPIEAYQQNNKYIIKNKVENSKFSTPVKIVGLYSKKDGYEMQIKQDAIKKVLINF